MFLNRRSTSRQRNITSIALFCCISSGTSFFLINWAHNYSSEYRELRSELPTLFGSRDLQLTAEWVMTHTQRDDIIASNIYCDEGSPCNLTDVKENLQKLDSFDVVGGDCMKYLSLNPLLPALSQRRY